MADFTILYVMGVFIPIIAIICIIGKHFVKTFMLDGRRPIHNVMTIDFYNTDISDHGYNIISNEIVDIENNLPVAQTQINKHIIIDDIIMCEKLPVTNTLQSFPFVREIPIPIHQYQVIPIT
jgi:hypothetical protein